jgi:hypothetical protein
MPELKKEQIIQAILQMQTGNQEKKSQPGNPEQQPQFLNQMPGQNLDPSQEQSLMDILLKSSFRQKASRTLIIENTGDVISESREGSIIDQNGFIHDIKENYVYVFADGSSTSPEGYTRCQSCGSTVKKVFRCPCGITVCQSLECPSKYSKSKNQWYCSTRHKTLDIFGISLR